MCLETTFKIWERSARKDGTGIYSSNFTFGDFRTWPRAPIDGCLSTSCILLSLLLYNNINDKIVLEECIFYHIQNCTSLHTFCASLEVIWALMFIWFFSPLICGIRLSAGLLTKEYSNNALRYLTDDEGMTAIVFISPSRWSLLPSQIICNGEF